jgi:hypothetical protein
MVVVTNSNVYSTEWHRGTFGHGGHGRKTRQLEPHRVLRVPRHETDPVRIILAAQIQLRRWRRSEPGRSPDRIQQRIQAIVAARDALVGAGKPLIRPV